MSDQITAPETGCLINGHFGQYISALICQMAQDYGWTPDEELSRAVALKLKEMTHLIDAELTPEQGERIDEGGEIAERWMNDNVAEPRHSFGWFDGEFFYWTLEAWNEAYA